MTVPRDSDHMIVESGEELRGIGSRMYDRMHGWIGRRVDVRPEEPKRWRDFFRDD